MIPTDWRDSGCRAALACRNSHPELDGGRLEKFKMDSVHSAFEALVPQHGKGNIAVSSPLPWRMGTALSNFFLVNRPVV